MEIIGRAEGLERLTKTTTNINDPEYLFNKYFFKDLKAVIEKYGSGDVLDIGCGNKPYKPLFGDSITSYIGCDVVQSSKKVVDIICYATDIPVEDNSKDTIFSTQVIEHVSDHHKMISECKRIAKPGGIIIISSNMYWDHHEEPYDFFRFTRHGFKYLYEEAGLEVLEILPNGGKWAMAGQVLLNNINSTFRNKRGIKVKMLKTLYFLFRIKNIINIFFDWLDKADRDYISTMNFVTVARRP